MKQYKQNLLFDDQTRSSAETIPSTQHSPWILFIDGASRNNPGPSGIGIHIAKDKTTIAHHGYFTGTKTNNQAEYLALIVGLLILEQYLKPFDYVEICADSQLLVRQMTGQYKIKNEGLKPYAHAARSLLQPLQYTIKHVLRDHNPIADALANKGIDKKIILPSDIVERLESYGITI